MIRLVGLLFSVLKELLISMYVQLDDFDLL